MTTSTSETASPDGRHYFLLRRLHSLLGLIPVGVFVVMHLTVNASVWAARWDIGDVYQQNVDRIHSLSIFLIPVEIVFIFVPLFFHAILGVKIWLTSRPNARNYPYGANIRYTLQRTTGVIAFVFIMYHLWHMHWTGSWFGGAFFDPEHATDSTARAMQQAVWIAPVYAVGVLATVFHLANGIWTSLITWGITVGARSQRKAAYVCAALGIILGVVGLSGVTGFRTHDLKYQPTENGSTAGHRSVDASAKPAALP